ncbi:MAG: RNA-binding transcriptional accessory protein [Chloroflexi bacterium]|nr:RNA-binding transcriptional accessory protein [Chloroflexota bacterium]MCI0574838.1 RNA-binding transcriptional accessory protein [Chloroflexota bacterium]MCI0645944.1 RNA-binding transcriptional accessory protein [Chloroflexota bacterium]MCI0727613.1 RNA-binding transcriptional accessory protein [Chloroflexota bacterium]
MDHVERIASQLNAGRNQVAAAVALLDDGNTLPFIARYRKEATGGLDDDQLRRLNGLLDSLRTLDKRRQTILDSIAAQGQLTPELEGQLLAAETLTALEDLYQPYKPKRRTRASAAREKGLQGLADLILAQEAGPRSLAELARPFLNDQVPTIDEALAGARDIVAETISDHAGVRQRTREKGLHWAVLSCQKIDGAEDPRQVYKLYYDYQCRVDRLRPHQVLAINRGEADKVLRLSLEIAERDWRQAVAAAFRPNPRSPLAGQLEMAVEDAAKRLLLPAIERDIRRSLTETAEAHAIHVFADNLGNLLTQPPLAGQTVLAIDPGYRTGCKVAVVDPTGKVLDTTTIYPHEPQKAWAAARQALAGLVGRHGVTLVAIGNGTASRETERLAAELIQELQPAGVKYLIVNEAGASVYSASPLARTELPELDVTLRGAVSIGRRVQDPLAELVKIDPRSIGIGLYQHDVNQGQLAAALEGVVESVVNRVGVEVNTASPSLLTYVAGIGPKLAENIVAYRDENGPFASRPALRQVPGLGPKAFEQAAGFLRIRDGVNSLDASAIHPESYHIATAVLERAGLPATAASAARERALARWHDETARRQLAAELGAGLPTLTDILEQLARPGRDPRADLPPPILRSDVLSMDDLKSGMRLKGTVRNVVDFGVFVDIGVKQDGLLHRSQWPGDVSFGVGDVIEVTIRHVEPERGRISLGWPEELR